MEIFDGHNDAVHRLTPESFFEGTDSGHIDWPRAQAGGPRDGVFGDFASMGVAGGLPRHRPEAKALAGVEGGGFQPA